MNKSAIHSLPDTSAWEPKYPFDLVVAYEDTTTRDQALRLYDHLAQTLLDEYDFQCSWWRFDLFRDSSLSEQAADAAAEANMVILCLRSGEHLPPLAKSWIETWLARKDDRKSALVTLVGDIPWEQREKCTANLYLRKIAHVGKMDFFTHTFELNPSPKTVHPLLNLKQPPPFMPFMANSNPHYHIPRWGINE